MCSPLIHQMQRQPSAHLNSVSPPSISASSYAMSPTSTFHSDAVLLSPLHLPPPLPTPGHRRTGSTDPAAHAYSASYSYLPPRAAGPQIRLFSTTKSPDDRVVAADLLLSLSEGKIPPIRSGPPHTASPARGPSHSRQSSTYSNTSSAPTSLACYSLSHCGNGSSERSPRLYTPPSSSRATSYSGSSTASQLGHGVRRPYEGPACSPPPQGTRDWCYSPADHASYPASSPRNHDSWSGSPETYECAEHRACSTEAQQEAVATEALVGVDDLRGGPRPKVMGNVGKGNDRNRSKKSRSSVDPAKPKPKQGKKKRAPGYVRPIILHRQRAGARLLWMLQNAPVPSRRSPQSLGRLRTFPFSDLQTRLNEWYGLRFEWPNDLPFRIDELRSTRRMRQDELQRLDRALDTGRVKLVFADWVLEEEPHRFGESRDARGFQHAIDEGEIEDPAIAVLAAASANAGLPLSQLDRRPRGANEPEGENGMVHDDASEDSGSDDECGSGAPVLAAQGRRATRLACTHAGRGP